MGISSNRATLRNRLFEGNPNQDEMKHEAEYNTLIGLAVGDDMDAEAFRVVANIDNDQTTAPRCVFYEGQVKDGDKVLFLKKLIVDTDPEEMIRFIPGFYTKTLWILESVLKRASTAGAFFLPKTQLTEHLRLKRSRVGSAKLTSSIRCTRPTPDMAKKMTQSRSLSGVANF